MTYLSAEERSDIKKFAVRFFTIGLLIFALDKGLALWATQAALNDLSVPESPVRIYRADTGAEAVFFGNSKTHCNINAALFSQQTGMKAWNWGIDGTNAEMTRFLFEEYLLHNKMPGIVFIQADYGLISQNLPGAFRPALVSPFTNVSRHTAGYFNPAYCDKLAFWFFRCKNFPCGEGFGALGRTMINYVLGRCTKTAAADMANGSQLSAPRRDAEKIKPSFAQTASKKIVLNPKKLDEYRRILDTAKSNNIRVILYGPPQYGKIDTKTAQEVDRLFGLLTEEYPLCEYWNFRETAELWENPQWWNDDVHLNINGTNVFTEIVVKKVTVRFPKGSQF